MRSLLAAGVLLASCQAAPPASDGREAPAEQVSWPKVEPRVTWPEAARPAAGGSAVTPGAFEEVAVPGDLPALVVRPAAGAAAIRTVFLTGSCTHPSTYLRAFAHAAAEHGGLVAVQGDLPCGDPAAGLRKWSADTALAQRRIAAALHAAGVDADDDLTVVGYSQGAERAEWLANRFPTKFTRFVLVASPIVPSPRRLAGAHAVVTIAGKGDVRENMADGARALRRDAIPAIYMELTSTKHGELDAATDDAVVAQAFDWLDENARAPRPRSRARVTRP